MTSLVEPVIRFGPVGGDLLDRVADLEAVGFPPDEAASRETMAYRLKNASTYFVGTWIDVASDNSSKTADMDPLHLIGYVVGTCTASEQLEHETMFTHNESGNHLCIHSVLTEPKFQNRGFAKKALSHYIEHIKKEAPHITKISLLSKASKTKLYEAVGFKLLGPSPVAHGQEQWFELSLNLA